MLIVTACALIDRAGQVLLARRPEGKPHAGSWEFPGGKAEPGEAPSAALIRELAEELGISTEESCLAPLTFESDCELLLLLYVCRKYKGVAQPREGQSLVWADPSELLSYDLVPLDRPLAAAVRDLLA